MKKTWKRPELVVLVRGSDEERILAGCKNYYKDIGLNSVLDGCTILGEDDHGDPSCMNRCTNLTVS
jgi:hypothetical protein